MGFIDWLGKVRSAVTEQRVDAFTPQVEKEIREFKGSELAKESTAPTIPFWFHSPLVGFPRRNFNAYEIRQYAKNPYVNMVINAIRKQLSCIKWEIVVSDEEDETDYSENITRVTDFLKYPNQNGDTFWDIWGPFVQDILEIDAGVIWKGKNGAGELTELYVYDAARFLMDVDKIGRINGYWQYSYTIPDGRPKFFDKKDMIYGMIGKNSEYYPYGWSPLQSIQQEVEVLIQSTRYNKEFFKNNAIPDGIIVAKMDKDSLKRLQQMWEGSVKGKAHKLLFLNNDADFKSMKVNNKDMDWKEMQRWYFHAVFGAYGLSPMEVGFFEDGNRATGESQERITIRNAIAPYMKLIENKINREIIPELIGDDTIKFKFFPKDDVAEKIEHEQIMSKLNAHVYTINEVRKIEGKKPVEWGDKPMMMGMAEWNAELGMASDNNNFNNETGKKKDDDNKSEDKRENPKDKDKKKDERDSKRESEAKKSVTKEAEIEPGKEMVEEADSYDKFLVSKFNKWEKEVLGFIDSTLSDEVRKEYVNKSFGDFLMRLFGSVNTIGFFTQLKAVLSGDYKKGVKAAEEELSVDIGVGINFDQNMKSITERQLDGFYIEGKQWKGLVGVADDTQVKIREIVQQGITEKKSTGDIKDEIKGIFNKLTGDTMTDGRAMKIARSESSRLIGSAKVNSYKKSGLKGKKVWSAFLDNRTSDLCKRLNGQKVDLYDDFVDPKTGKKYDHNPSHPSCRCVVNFVPN